MGSKYKKKLEIEWEGNPISNMRVKALQIQADKNISDIMKGKFKKLGPKKK